MLRPVTPADRDDVIALVLAEDAAWSGASEVSTDEVGELIDSYPPGVVFEDGGRITGYAAIEGGGEMLAIDPAAAMPALEALVGWLVDRGIREVSAYANDEQRIAWLEEHGFAHVRSAFDLERGIEPALAAAAWPPGIEIAPYRPGEDDDAVYALVYVDAAWSEVPGHHDRPLEAWSATFAREYRGWVARHDARPVGWIAGRVFSDGRGWIEQLAVARSHRGQGLGRALLLHALADLREQGATGFALGVEAANDSALGLYRAAGFRVEREFRVFAR